MSSLGIFNKETKTYQKVAGTAEAAVVDAEMSDTSTNIVQNKVIKKYVDDHMPEVDAAMSDTSVNPVQNKVIKKYVDEKQVNIDGITLTLDEAKNVIKLADTLKDKIGSALQPESIVNNQTTTVEGFALDARQANPNIYGSLAKQISDLNGSINNTFISSCMNIVIHKKMSFDFSSGEQIVFMWFFYPKIIDSVSLYVVENSRNSNILQLISAKDTVYNPEILNSDGKVSISFDSYYMGYMMFSTSTLKIDII